MCVDIREGDDHGTKASMSESGIRDSTGISAFQFRRTSIISMEIENWLVDWQNINIKQSALLLQFECLILPSRAWKRLPTSSNRLSGDLIGICCSFDGCIVSKQSGANNVVFSTFHSTDSTTKLKFSWLNVYNSPASTALTSIKLYFNIPTHHMCVCVLTNFIYSLTGFHLERRRCHSYWRLERSATDLPSIITRVSIKKVRSIDWMPQFHTSFFSNMHIKPTVIIEHERALFLWLCNALLPLSKINKCQYV